MARARIAIVLVALGVSGALLGRGVVELAVGPLVSFASPAERVEAEVVVRDRLADGDAILARNVFDSRLDLTEPPDCPDCPDPPVHDEERPSCDGLRLAGSVVDAARPERSMVALVTTAGRDVFGIGGRVGERTVTAIDRERVVLEDERGACEIAMFEPPPVEEPVEREVPPTVGRIVDVDPSLGGVTAETLDAAITETAAGHWTVSRSLVDELERAGPAVFATARAIPRSEDGRVIGMQLFGIRRAGLLGRLGIQNGDVVRSVNGFDLSDPTEALAALAALRDAERLTVHLDRRGARTTLDYEIR